MRLLHVDSGRVWRGGQAQVAYLLSGLVARGCAPLLAAPPESPLHERLRGLGVSTLELPMHGDLDFGAMRRLADWARRQGVDLIHAHTATAHAIAVGAARLAGIPLRIVTRRVDRPASGLLGRWKYGTGVTHYVAISRRVAEQLAASGVDPKRISIVHSGIPVAGVPQAGDPDARRTARTKLGAPGDEPLIGVIGAFTPEKGQDLAIQALAAIEPPARLVLVGEGPERARLEALARRTGVAGRITWTGFRNDVAGLLPGFDIILAPSRHEGLGTAVLEVMAAGVPVVATRVSEFPELLLEGAAGRLVPAGDSAALAAAAAGLLDRPPERVALGQAGRRRAAEYSVERMIAGNVRLYDLLSGRSIACIS